MTTAFVFDKLNINGTAATARTFPHARVATRHEAAFGRLERSLSGRFFTAARTADAMCSL
jgi:hypothetical protein